MFAINATHAEDPKSGKINYVREDIPAISMKPYEGETSNDLIPDTLDMAERDQVSLPDPLARLVTWAMMTVATKSGELLTLESCFDLEGHHAGKPKRVSYGVGLKI